MFCIFFYYLFIEYDFVCRSLYDAQLNYEFLSVKCLDIFDLLPPSPSHFKRESTCLLKYTVDYRLAKSGRVMKSTSSPEYMLWKGPRFVVYNGHHFGFALFQEAASIAWIGNTFWLNSVRRNEYSWASFHLLWPITALSFIVTECNELPQLLNLTALGRL